MGPFNVSVTLLKQAIIKQPQIAAIAAIMSQDVILEAWIA